MFEKVEAKRMREFAWFRVLGAAAGLALVNCTMFAAGGVPARTLGLVFVASSIGWLLLITGYYVWVLKRTGVLVFPRAYWRKESSDDRADAA